MDPARERRSLLGFCLLEFVLSVPFWGISVLANAGVIPDFVMFRAAWSLTPMMAASILVYRESKAVGVKALFRRIVDYQRITSPIWYLPLFLLGPSVIFVQYGLALWSGLSVPPPHLTLLVPFSFVGFFLIVYGEELGWTAYAVDALQESRSAFVSGMLVGIMWATFHAPVWYLAGMSLQWCAWQGVFVVALRVLMVWVYDNMGRSLFAMDLLHPGFFVWWYLWPVTGTGLSMPTFYDPRNLALTTTAAVVLVTFLWGPKTLAQFRWARAAVQRPR